MSIQSGRNYVKRLLQRWRYHHPNGLHVKCYTTSSKQPISKSYKLVVVGGGAGGSATAAKFASKLGKGRVAVIEPCDTHYYQPLWTLVGGGLKDFNKSWKPMASVLASDAEWIHTKVAHFHPDQNKVTTEEGDDIAYEYLVVAMGLSVNYHQIKGLTDALDTPGVGSIYHPQHVQKITSAWRNFTSGNAVFTFPKPPVKCAGAPQKIMYITERQLVKRGVREKAKVIYHTALPVLFGVQKYSDSLWKVVERRNIDVQLNSNLVEVVPDKKIAIFENLAQPNEPTKTHVEYQMLHVVPPMTTPPALSENSKKPFVDDNGFVNVDKDTLQHVHYPNIFSIGDCSNLPTAKTAAAVAAEIGILRRNLTDVMAGKMDLKAKYDGYTSCPLVIGPGQCILAEFDYGPQPLETFPIDQGQPRRVFFYLKTFIMPQVYWLMTKGWWEGPAVFRKLFHLGFSR